MASGPITLWQIDGGKVETVMNFIFLGSKITADGDCSHEIKRCLLLGRKAMTNLNRLLKGRGITAHKGLYSQSCGFSSSYVWMWELDHKEGWAPKNWCFWTMCWRTTFESPLNSKEIKPVNSNRNQPWVFIGRTDAKATAPILWPPDAKCCVIGKDPGAEKDWERRIWRQQRLRCLDDIADSMGMSSSMFWETVKDRESWHATIHGVAANQSQLSNWTAKRKTCKILVWQKVRKCSRGMSFFKRAQASSWWDFIKVVKFGTIWILKR